MMRGLIGLTGCKESGKDATAALLKMVGYTRYAFADEVRREAEQSFDDNAAIPHFPDHIMGCWLECANEKAGVLWQKPMLPAARQLLQWFGSEYRRAQDPEYWIKKLQIELSTHIEDFPIVISDVRFQNEAAFLRARGGVIWRVDRPGCKPDGHVSETELLGIACDYVVHNDGDMQNLATQVLKGLHLAQTTTK